MVGQNCEILEDKLYISGFDAYYCCLWYFKVDIKCLKEELTKQRMHAIYCLT